MPTDAEVREQAAALLSGGRKDQADSDRESADGGWSAPIPTWAGLALGTVGAVIGFFAGAIVAGDTTTVQFPDSVTVTLDGDVGVDTEILDVTTTTEAPITTTTSTTSTTTTTEPPPPPPSDEGQG